MNACIKCIIMVYEPAQDKDSIAVLDILLVNKQNR